MAQLAQLPSDNLRVYWAQGLWWAGQDLSPHSLVARALEVLRLPHGIASAITPSKINNAAATIGADTRLESEITSHVPIVLVITFLVGLLTGLFIMLGLQRPRRQLSALERYVFIMSHIPFRQETTMEYFETVKARRSIREFQKKAIEEEKILRVIETVSVAPSAGNLQAYEVVVVKDPVLRDDLAKAAWSQNFISEAPVCFVFLACPERSSKKYGKRGNDLYCLQDATIAATYAMLTATALGLSSTWVGAFDEEAAARTVGARKGKRPVVILPVGYAAETPEETPRRPVSDMMYLDESEVPYPFSFTDKSFERPTWKPRTSKLP